MSEVVWVGIVISTSGYNSLSNDFVRHILMPFLLT